MGQQFYDILNGGALVNVHIHCNESLIILILCLVVIEPCKLWRAHAKYSLRLIFLWDMIVTPTT